jgi:hypothetical protein
MDIRTIDLSYLKPPQDVLKVQHSDYYICHGEGKKEVRKIFFNVPRNEFEERNLKDFTQMIIDEKLTLPSNWKEADTFRYCYCAKFDLPKCLPILKNHLAWKLDNNTYILEDAALEYLKKGILYYMGRDKEYRPVIMINVHLIDFKAPVEVFIKALGALLFVISKYCFVPGKVENWIIMIETNSVGVFGFPFMILKKIIEFTSANFSSTMEKLYLLNPSFGLNTSWNVVKAMLDVETASKISFVKESNFIELQEKIPAERLIQKYGGTLPNFTTFWPPVNDLKGIPMQSPLMIKSRALDLSVTTSRKGNNHTSEHDLTVYYDCESQAASAAFDMNDSRRQYFDLEASVLSTGNNREESKGTKKSPMFQKTFKVVQEEFMIENRSNEDTNRERGDGMGGSCEQTASSRQNQVVYEDFRQSKSYFCGMCKPYDASEPRQEASSSCNIF